jgi:hypothetical protein
MLHYGIYAYTLSSPVTQFVVLYETLITESAPTECNADHTDVCANIDAKLYYPVYKNSLVDSVFSHLNPLY